MSLCFGVLETADRHTALQGCMQRVQAPDLILLTYDLITSVGTSSLRLYPFDENGRPGDVSGCLKCLIESNR